MPDATDSGRTRPPSVDALLRDPRAVALAAEYGASSVTDALRRAIDDARDAWQRGDPPGGETLIERTAAMVAARREPRLRRVFNLTGTTLHTNLGRAPYAEAAIAAAVSAMRHPIAVEFDLATGGRGDRDAAVEALVAELTGAEAATVVNNNAAGVLLALDTLAGTGAKGAARKREAIVSRGELVEIGGAFRVPDIMRRAGCKLVEVGTTNRTHASDYRDAMGPDTALLMRVHASNYRIEGFVAMPSEREVATIAHDAALPMLVDLGAGALIDLAAHGLPHEPTVRETLAAGADVVTFSGDKLLGGPQAGFIAGRRDLIAAMKKSPLKRALRCDKVTLAALEATLMLYREPEHLAERLTALRWLARPQAAIRDIADRLVGIVAASLDGTATVQVESCASQIGSGAQPVDLLPSAALVIRPVRAKGGGRVLATIEAALRALPIPVIGRVTKGALWLDCRTLEDADAFVASWSALALPPPEGERPR
jgi:L-seryl-tRNA(Ser) seleniumtransferase